MIDFLAIPRRPDPGRFFARFLKITARYHGRLGMPTAGDESIRGRLAALAEEDLARVLTDRELESLRIGCTVVHYVPPH